MGTSKARTNLLTITMAQDPRYKFQKNGIIKKRGSDGKYRKVGTERHGYNVVPYKGTRLVSARVLVAHAFVKETNLSTKELFNFLSNRVVIRANGDTLNDKVSNIYTSSKPPRTTKKRLTQKQIDRMMELFFDGNSVAKIARRFRRKVSRSYVSKIIRNQIGLETLGGLK